MRIMFIWHLNYPDSSSFISCVDQEINLICGISVISITYSILVSIDILFEAFLFHCLTKIPLCPYRIPCQHKDVIYIFMAYVSRLSSESFHFHLRRCRGTLIKTVESVVIVHQ